MPDFDKHNNSTVERQAAGELQPHAGNTVSLVGSPKSIFVAVRKSGIVMRGAEFIAKCCSHTMAKRIANALNEYKTNDRGE